MDGYNWGLYYVILTFAQLSFLSAATLRITRVGRYLYDANGNRFYIKGVSFQSTGKINQASREHLQNGGFPETADFKDPLADPPACNQAIANLKKLHINTLRVYSYDHKLDHTPCMNALEKAGIYVIADLNLPVIGSIHGASPSWNVDSLTTHINQIESLRKFPNLLAFNIGNEVVTSIDSLEGAPFIKAAARDVKAYLKSVNSAALISYTSTDGKKFPADLARFLTCDPSGQSPGLDLFGVDNYRWCGESNFEEAYEDLTVEFQGLNIAAFFSEFGCLTPGKPRVWTEVAAIFSARMSDLWSGAVAYNYYPTPRGYGLLSGAEKKPSEATPDFRYLADQYRRAKPPNIPKLTSLSPPKTQCTSTNANSFVITSTLPPEPNAEACNCVNLAALSCQVNTNAPPAVVGELLDQICKSLGNTYRGGSGGACDLIYSKPSKGKYGILSACSAVTKLNYAMTQKFIKSGHNSKACSYGGNATVQDSIPKKLAEEVDQDTKKCFEVNRNRGMRQINTKAYQESISGARTQSKLRTSGTSSNSSKRLPSLEIKKSGEICV